MNNIFAGIMGILMSISAVFHTGAIAHTNHPSTIQEASVSATPAPSGYIHRGFGHGRGKSMINGLRPFFGTVTSVNGSTLTIQMIFLARGFLRSTSITPTITPGGTQTLTIDLDNSTTYIGGSQGDITINTKIAGIGKVNSDGSITATQVRIHPTMPSGFPQGQWRNDDHQ